MGHDIYGTINKRSAIDDSTAYLRRNMFSDGIHVFYEILGASDFDNGVSGSGESKEFTEEEIELAIKNVKKSDQLKEEDKEDFVDFLEEFLANKCKYIEFS